MKRFLSHWFPPLAWMGLIYFLSDQPDLPQAPGAWPDTLLKKTGHALGYGILAWLYLRPLRGRLCSATSSRALSFGLAVLYGLSDEYHQTFVPGRNGTLWDVAVDGIGVCGAMLLDWWLQRRRIPLRATDAR